MKISMGNSETLNPKPRPPTRSNQCCMALAPEHPLNDSPAFDLETWPQAWKAKVAELKMDLEERERRERKLSMDLRAKVDEIQGLKDRLAAAERRMMKQLAGAGGSEYSSVPLYERVNNSVSLRLPSIPSRGGGTRCTRGSRTPTGEICIEGRGTTRRLVG